MSVLITLEDRIFVAGHRGMAGSAICRALQRGGYKNVLTADRSALDLEDSAAVESWFDAYKPSVVVLAAAKVGGIHANKTYPADFLLSNLKIQNNVIERAWMSGVKRLLFLGSSCIYPRLAEQPIREESLLTGSLESTNEGYALAKIAGLKLCSYLRRQHGFDAISLMPTNLYGPGDNYCLNTSHVLPAFIRKFHEARVNSESSVVCWGTGSARREFLHVDDLGEACRYALEHWDPTRCDVSGGSDDIVLDLMNVGTGKDLTIKTLAEKVALYTGYEGEIEWDSSFPDGTPRKLLDVSRFSCLGWRAKIGLDTGLASTIEDFRLNYPKHSFRE